MSIEDTIAFILESQSKAQERADRADARMDRAEARMDRAEARAEQMDARFEKRMRGFEKLAKIGMRELADMRRFARQSDERSRKSTTRSTLSSTRSSAPRPACARSSIVAGPATATTAAEASRAASLPAIMIQSGWRLHRLSVLRAEVHLL